MANKKSINIFLGLNDSDFQKGLKKARKNLTKFGNSMKSTGKSLTTNLTAPLVGIGVIAGKTFMDFEQSMLKVKAISGATGEQFKMLEADAKALGSTTMFTASQVAGLQLELSKLGLTPEEINNSTESILNLAQATDSDLSQSAMVAAKTMQAFGLEASDMTRITDVMADSFSSSALDMTKFETAMGSVAPVAKGAGASLEETTAILGVLVNNGVEASTAGTALRNIFLDLAKDGKTMGEAMDEINNSTNPLADAMEMFGKRGATVATILANNGVAIQDLTEDFKDSKGEASAMARIMDSGLGGSLRKLLSQLEGLAIQIGEILVPVFSKIMSVIASLVNKFTSLDDGTKKIIVGFGLVAAAIGPIITIVGALIAGFAALASPVYITIAALVAGGIIIYNNWEPFKKVLADLINYFIDLYNESIGFRYIVESIAFVFKQAFAQIKFFVMAGIALIKGFASNFTSLFGGIGDIIKGVFTLDVDTLKKGLTDAKDALAETFNPANNEDLAKATQELAETTAENFKTGFDNLLGKNPVEYITEDDIQNTVDKAGDLATQIGNTMKGLLGGGIATTPTPESGGAMMGPQEFDYSTLDSLEEQEKSFWDKSEKGWSDWATKGQENIAGFVETWGSAFSKVGDILTQHIANKQETLKQDTAIQLEEQELQLEQKMLDIENSRLSEEEKAKAIEDAKIEHGTSMNSIQETADKESRRLARKQAKVDKMQAALQIAVSTASAIMKAVAASPLTGGMPWSAAIGVLGGIQLGTVLAAPLPALAEGGLAFGETAAIVGDNPNASVDPEVIAPLSKLRDMLGGGMQTVNVVGALRGEDIVLSTMRTNQRLNRLS